MFDADIDIDIEMLRPPFESWYVLAHPKAIEPLRRYRHSDRKYAKVHVQDAWRAWIASHLYTRGYAPLSNRKPLKL